MNKLEQGLKEKFNQQDLQARVLRSGVKKDGKVWAVLALYIDSRQVQERLDEVVGFNNWRTEYITSDKGVICNLLLKIDGEWVGKQDGSDYSDIEAFKGGISGALRRAAVMWGIGRYLYDLTDIYADISETKKDGYNYAKDSKSGKEFYWAVPKLPAEALPEKKEIKPNLISADNIEIISQLTNEALNLGFIPKYHREKQDITKWTEEKASEMIGKLTVKVEELKRKGSEQGKVTI